MNEFICINLQDSQLETMNLTKSIAVVELYKWQINVALNLEMAYNIVSDHPDVAKEVLLSNCISIKDYVCYKYFKSQGHYGFRLPLFGQRE